ncbi:MAG: hypothetical protein ACJKTH_02710 [Patescibacteria group bacterium UBA2163]
MAFTEMTQKVEKWAPRVAITGLVVLAAVTLAIPVAEGVFGIDLELPDSE